MYSFSVLMVKKKKDINLVQISAINRVLKNKSFRVKNKKKNEK